MILPRRRHRRPTHTGTTRCFSIYEPIPFGIDENGRSVEVTLMYRNLLAGGEPGSGKSSLLNTIIAHAVLCSDVKLWLFDGKIVELGLWRPVADVFVGNTIRDALTRLRDLQAEMDTRYRLLVLQRRFGVSWDADRRRAVMIAAWSILPGGSRRWTSWWS